MEWLNQYESRKTRNSFQWGLNFFLEFLGPGWSLQRLLSERREDIRSEKFEFEQKVVDFYRWLKIYVTKPTEKTIVKNRNGKPFTVKYRRKGGIILSDYTRKSTITAVQCFFACHRLNLRFTPQQKNSINKNAKPKENDYLFSLSDIEAMAKVANPQEKFILFAGKDEGLRALDFKNIPQGYYAIAVRNWRNGEESPVFLGKFWTQKEGVWAFSFLTEDGLNTAEVWLKILESKRLRNDDAPMLQVDEKELTNNLRRLAEKAGIDPHGLRIRFHCLRKFLIDRISLKMSESKWKQIVGKAIDESTYVSQLELREAYLEVMNRIQIEKNILADPVLKDVEKLMRLPRGREFFDGIVKDAKAKLAKMFEQQNL